MDKALSDLRDAIAETVAELDRRAAKIKSQEQLMADAAARLRDAMAQTSQVGALEAEFQSMTAALKAANVATS